jgi:hypothetical protein
MGGDSDDEEFKLALAVSKIEEEEQQAERRELQKQMQDDEALARRLEEEERRRAPSALPLPPPSPPPASSIIYNSQCCPGCGAPLQRNTPSSHNPILSFLSPPQPTIQALGKTWHPACFKCSFCHLPFHSTTFAVDPHDSKPRPYHPHCLKQKQHPKCDICQAFLPTQGGGNRIVYNEAPFWKIKYCSVHNTDGTARCDCCTRLQLRRDAASWVDLTDGRKLCEACLGCGITADTHSAQPLYAEIISFYSQLGLYIAQSLNNTSNINKHHHKQQQQQWPPLALVENAALNDAQGGARQGPVFHTRGVCLAESYQQFYSTHRTGFLGLLMGMDGGSPPSSSSSSGPMVPAGPVQHRVTAILVLHGLPRLLTGSIIAHECMHAWLRLSGFLQGFGAAAANNNNSNNNNMSHQLPVEMEEGLAQLMAFLWLQRELEHRRNSEAVLSAYEARLTEFLMYQIQTDPSLIYGDGFRMVYDAFLKCECQVKAVLDHIYLTGGVLPP